MFKVFAFARPLSLALLAIVISSSPALALKHGAGEKQLEGQAALDELLPKRTPQMGGQLAPTSGPLGPVATRLHRLGKNVPRPKLRPDRLAAGGFPRPRSGSANNSEGARIPIPRFSPRYTPHRTRKATKRIATAPPVPTASATPPVKRYSLNGFRRR